LFSETHCHLRSISDDAIRHVEKLGVELVLNAGTDLVSSEEAVLTSGKYRIVKACVGVHPWNADIYDGDVHRRLKKFAAHPGVVAISEIGLDYVGRRNPEGKYLNEYIDKRIQLTAFREQLKLAKQLNLPVIVHDRTPDQEVLEIIDKEGNAEIGVVIHGFSKDLAYAKKCLDMNIYISIGLRAMTAADNKELEEVIKHMPLKSLLTETDSGNPEGVLAVAEKIAALKGLTKDYVGQSTTQNLRKLTRL
jgi:TatD DNase family protein